MQEDRNPTNATPLFQRSGVRKLCFGLLAVALLWLVFGDSDDDAREDWDDSGFALEDGEIPGVGAGYPDARDPAFADYAPDNDLEDLEELGYASDYEDTYDGGYEESAGFEGGYEGQYGGNAGGYAEEGAFRGQAEVGGSPLVSGTVDTSGGGNSVYSVGGEVIELP